MRQAINGKKTREFGKKYVNKQNKDNNVTSEMQLYKKASKKFNVVGVYLKILIMYQHLSRMLKNLEDYEKRNKTKNHADIFNERIT